MGTKDIVNQDLCSNSASGVKLSTLVSSKKMLACFTCPRTTSLGFMTCNRARSTKEEIFNQPWLKRSLLVQTFFFFVTRRSDDSFSWSKLLLLYTRRFFVDLFCSIVSILV